MKPHRTPLLANAVTGSLRSPAQGPVVPAAAYAAHTQSSASSAPDDSDPRLTNSRQSSALRERLSQTRARIARAHAERPPQIDLEWDAEEPLTRVYHGEKLALPRDSSYASVPAQYEHTHALEQFSEPPAPADHSNDPWYSDLDAHAGATDYAVERAQAQPAQAPTVVTRNHADAAIAAQRRHPTPTDLARPAHVTRSSQSGRATPSDFVRAPLTDAAPTAFAHGAQRSASTYDERAHEPSSFASSNGRPARTERAQLRSFTRAQTAHSERATGMRTHAEQALTARVAVPVARPPSLADEIPRENFLPPAAASDPSSTQRERLTHTLTSTMNTLRERLGELYAGIDRSDPALRKRVTYCSLGLLIVAALSRIAFTGAASDDSSSSESSQAAATSPTVLQTTSVSISSDPPGALITLDGETSNRATPSKLTELAPGRHTISLKLAGYAETKEALNLPADALVSIKLAALDEPRFAPPPTEQRTTISRAEQRAQARELARERRAAARAAKVLLRYRARMGLPPDPVAQELVDAYGPSASAE